MFQTTNFSNFAGAQVWSSKPVLFTAKANEMEIDYLCMEQASDRALWSDVEKVDP